ncbi:DNA-protecting protein DprA [Nitrincola tibetensis]|uniref:DNA-protecting protein DprA n=1 Tax=Nitrincola tibetensis TaxID=2219697 RepID=A0A364NLS6_9GAMM|nr:DNA-processing protein DprA [Nitrincola tibetensis]RAU18011.1 DNA-protecting protein DprA [Nitrincola tibetensis]
MKIDPREWIALLLVPGLGPGTLSRLVELDVNLRDLLDGNLPDDIRLRPDTTMSLRQKSAGFWLDQAQQIQDKAEQHQIECVCLGADDYPPLLQNLPDPPPVLWFKGCKTALYLPQLAVVGSRKPTQSGARLAYLFSAELAKSGFAITSGLALGIDTQAHKGCLSSNGVTLAVMGTSPELIYPKSNAGLAREILDKGGCLISELMPGSAPLSAHFPRRNRIISGLSVGSLVVEAATRSGSLITARLAMEQGREVFAVPGPISNPMSKGCHELIRQGATLVDSTQHITEHLGALLGYLNEDQRAKQPSKLPQVKPEWEPILRTLSYDQMTFDDLMMKTNMQYSALQNVIMELVLAGRVIQDGVYLIQTDSAGIT